MTDLEARVTALEMAADLAALSSAISSSQRPLTDAERAGFIEALAEARERNRYRILNAPLNPDEVRQILRECAVVVKPGETLFLTPHDQDITPNQLRDLRQVIDWWLADNAPHVRVLILPPGKMGIAEADDAA